MPKTFPADEPPASLPEIPFLQKRGGPRYLGLQWVRVFACGIVLVFHGTLYLGDRRLPIFYRGAAGVDLFFVLSGFVIFASAQKLISAADGWRTFARHRLLRVVPMYWLLTTVALALLLVEGVLHHHPRPDFLWVLCSYLFLPFYSVAGEPGPVLAVGWTLNFEMLFYALCTLVLALRWRMLPSVGILLLPFVVGSLLKQPGWPFLSQFMDPIVLEFWLGMLIAQLCLKGRILPPFMAYVSGAAALVFLCWWPWTGPSSRLINFGLLAAVLIYAVASLEPLFRRTPRGLLLLADATYVLYLIHVPLMLEVAKAAGRHHVEFPVVKILVASLLAVALALVLRIWIEVPLLRRLQSRPFTGSRLT